MANAVLISIRPKWVKKDSGRRKDTGSQKDPSRYGNAVQGVHLLHQR